MRRLLFAKRLMTAAAYAAYVAAAAAAAVALTYTLDTGSSSSSASYLQPKENSTTKACHMVASAQMHKPCASLQPNKPVKPHPAGALQLQHAATQTVWGLRLHRVEQHCTHGPSTYMLPFNQVVCHACGACHA